MYKELSKKIKEYKDAVTRLEQTQSNKTFTAGAIDGLAGRIRDFLNNRCGNIINSIVALFERDTVRDSNGRLTLNGATMPEASFNRTNAAELADKLQNMMISSITELTRAGIGGQGTDALVAKIYFCHNTLLDIAEASARYVIEDERSARAALELKLFSAEEEIRRVGEELCAAVAKVGDVMLSNDTKVEQSFVDDVVLPLGIASEIVADKKINIPALWSLDNCGTVMIRASEEELEHSGLDELIENTVMSFLLAYPAATKRIMLSDLSCSSRLISFVSSIAADKRCATLFAGGSEGGDCWVHTTSDGVIHELSRLQISQRIATTGGEIFEYNKANPENAQPPVLVVVRGLGRSVNYSNSELIKGLLANGKKAGIFFLIIDTDSGLEAIGKMSDSMLYTYSGESRTVSDELTNTKYSIDIRKVGFSVSRAVNRLSSAISGAVSYIALSSLNKSSDLADFSTVLSIPIGKEGVRDVRLELMSKSSAAHCVISGMTGSGKSSLLHDIILGCAAAYSPNEVEMWLFDFKSGSELTVYESLKHVRCMSLNNSGRDATDLMNYIFKMMNERHTLIGKEGSRDITAYNEDRRARGEALMTRVLIVIDEYTVIRSQKCIDAFENIASKGRSVGISFVIASQTSDGMFRNIVSQAGHKFEFLNRTLGMLVPSCTERDRDFLSALPGNCVYSDGTVTHRMRSAYVGDRGVEKEIARINALYPRVAYERPLVMGDVRGIGARGVLSSVDELKAEYRKSREIRTPIGRGWDGGEVLLSIGHGKAHAVILGDDARCASAELSVMQRVALLSGDNSVYYIDLYKSADRMPNPIADGEDRKYRYMRKNSDIVAGIKELHDILLERDRALDEGDPVGSPILLLLHGAEFLSERADGIKRSKAGASARNSSIPDLTGIGSLDSEDLDSIAESLLGRSTASQELTAEEVDILPLLSAIVTLGARVRIYTVLHFERGQEMRPTLDRLMRRGTIGDYLVIPSLATDEGRVPAAGITAYLALTGAGVGDFDKDGSVSASDLIYGYLVTGNTVRRFIPYEEDVL